MHSKHSEAEMMQGIRGGELHSKQTVTDKNDNFTAFQGTSNGGPTLFESEDSSK
jgi:hypothetical protein